MIVALRIPADVASGFLNWGDPGEGKEMTVWVQPGGPDGIHVFTALQRGKGVNGRNESGQDAERDVRRFEREMR